ncbi:MAG: hypothetical protein RMJ16_14085 [Thermoguttaceae bacterium]|nr:hypothetical protein [Thermoguttaceae bacterium]
MSTDFEMIDAKRKGLREFRGTARKMGQSFDVRSRIFVVRLNSIRQNRKAN